MKTLDPDFDWYRPPVFCCNTAANLNYFFKNDFKFNNKIRRRLWIPIRIPQFGSMILDTVTNPRSLTGIKFDRIWKGRYSYLLEVYWYLVFSYSRFRVFRQPCVEPAKPVVYWPVNPVPHIFISLPPGLTQIQYYYECPAPDTPTS
jgi:hypothetical protein